MLGHAAWEPRSMATWALALDAILQGSGGGDSPTTASSTLRGSLEADPQQISTLEPLSLWDKPVAATQAFLTRWQALLNSTS